MWSPLNSKQLIRCGILFLQKLSTVCKAENQVLGIGPEKVSSIAYIRKVPGTVVIDDASEIEAAISSLVKNQALFAKNVESTRGFAQKHHEIEAVQESLRNSFEHLLDKDN